MYFSISAMLISGSLAYLTYALLRAVYNVTLHPLTEYPGPKLYAAFNFMHYWQLYRGNHVSFLHYLHETYGEVVRWGPNMLSYTTSQAHRDIYGTQRTKRGLPKDREFYSDNFNPVENLAFSSEETHPRQRRVMIHAFSDQALRDQESIIRRYCDLLISKLYERCGGPEKGKVDMVSWMNFTTFDVVGDLTFAESFGALERGEYHFWMTAIFRSIKFGVVFRIARYYPMVNKALMAVVDRIPSVTAFIKRLAQDTEDKTMRRVKTTTDRKDFMSHIIRQHEKNADAISMDEIISNADALIKAGSETTATLLSGLTFYLVKDPARLAKLKDEIRSSFDTIEDMTFISEAKLPYLQACIDEGLRMYPPVPIELPRITPPQGAVINGEVIPGGISVGVPQYPTFHSSRNFKYPHSFRPERWLSDPEYQDDDLSAVQPFSVGPRNCIGKQLAYAEIRAIVCRLLWNFDMELCPESENWNQQKVFFLWEKGPLMIQLTPRR